MNEIIIKIGWVLLTLFIVLNYGLLLRAIMMKLVARIGRRIGIPFYQMYINLFKAYALRTHIFHGVMYYLGPVFRLTGGVGMLLFLPVIYGDPRFSNFSASGDLILVLYFMFFGTLGMALGAGEGGHPNAAIGVTRGLSLMSVNEIPLTISVIAIAIQYNTLDIVKIVEAQQGGFTNWLMFTNPLAFITGIFGLLGSFGYGPFSIIIAPQETPIGPPTEYEGNYMGVLELNRSIFPGAKLILFMNLFLGGAISWPILVVKTFFFYLFFVMVGAVFPRYRTEQAVRWFIKVPLAVGIITLIVTPFLK